MHNIEKLIRIIERIFGSTVDTSNVTPASRLKEDLGMNSISMLYVAVAIEEEFGIELTNSDLGNLITVQDVLNRIERRT